MSGVGQGQFQTLCNAARPGASVLPAQLLILGHEHSLPLLEPDLRVNPEQLLKSLSQDTGRMHWGTVPETFVSPNHLEAQLEECKGLIARHRLSLERQIRKKKALLDEVEQQVQPQHLQSHEPSHSSWSNSRRLGWAAF